MNICFVYQGKHIVTPSLSGSILPGITRDSILKLAPEIGYSVSEERLDITQILSDIEEGMFQSTYTMNLLAFNMAQKKIVLVG